MFLVFSDRMPKTIGLFKTKFGFLSHFFVVEKNHPIIGIKDVDGKDEECFYVSITFDFTQKIFFFVYQKETNESLSYLSTNQST